MADRGVRGAVMSWLSGWRCSVLAAGCLLALAGSLRADIVILDPEGTKRVPVTIEVDWGPFAERVSRLHVVQAGETLRAIARKYLDDAERWKEIVEENPDEVVAPDVIHPGAKLWVPPKNLRTGEKNESATRHDALAHRYDACWISSSRFSSGLGGRATPGVVPAAYKSGGTLLFATPERLRTLSAALEERNRSRLADTWAGTLRAYMHPDNLLATEDPAVRIVVRYELTGRFDDRVTMKTTTTRYDADDEPVTEEFDVPEFGAGRDEPPPPDKEPEKRTDDGAIRRSDDLPPPEDGLERWSGLAGVIVAFLGLVIVAGAAYARRRAARSKS